METKKTEPVAPPPEPPPRRQKYTVLRDFTDEGGKPHKKDEEVEFEAEGEGHRQETAGTIAVKK